MGGERVGRLRQAVGQQVRAAFQDLFGEGASGSSLAGSTWAEESQALLAEADARLAELRQAGAAALARAHQAERAWEAARQDSERLDASVDEALRAGQERLARDRQRALNLRRPQLAALDAQRRSATALAGELAQASQSLEAQIDAVRLCLDQAAVAEQAAAAREPVQVLRQTLARLAESAAAGKDRWE